MNDCDSCFKQKKCPKSTIPENYHYSGCCEAIPKEPRTEGLYCAECGHPMQWECDYHYPKPYGRMITGDVYHCPNCDNDEVVERKWEMIDAERRKYFHG